MNTATNITIAAMNAKASADPGRNVTPDMRLSDCGGVQLPGWQLGWAQVIGRHHPRITEDTVSHRSSVLPDQRFGGTRALCLAVADGVGGGSRGEVASAALAAHSVALPDELLGRADAIAQWMQLAEGQVQIKLRDVSNSPGASTLAAAWLRPVDHELVRSDGGAKVRVGVQGHIMRVGDARLYRFDGNSVQPLTSDQTYASVGEIAPEGASQDDPARMVGTGFMGEPELVPVHLADGHTLLLCSDGLHRGLTAEQMAKLLREGGDLSMCALRLAQSARLGGSDDDITVLLAHVSVDLARSPRATSKPWRNLFNRMRS
jgi:serine/threonine protein phosphatase PrpC